MTPDSIDAAERALKQLLRADKDLLDSMSHATQRLGDDWHRRLAAIDWSLDLHEFERWVQSWSTQAPVPSDAEALWFEVPDIGWNPATTMVSAHPWFNRRSAADLGDPIDWAASRTNLLLPQLDRLRILDHHDNDSEPINAEAGAMRTVELCLIGSLVRHALARHASTLLVSHPRPIAIFAGWHDGSLYPLGTLSTLGWSNRVASRAGPIPTPAASLDPESSAFSVRDYLRTKPDLHARNARGLTPLHQTRVWATVSTLRALIDAGADANARLPDGSTILSGAFSWDLPLLRFLLDRGCDATALDELGRSTLDIEIGAFCVTVAHLRLLFEHGARFSRSRKDGLNAFHEMIETGGIESPFVKRFDLLLDWALGHGLTIHDRDDNGWSPLWISLGYAAEEFGRHIGDANLGTDGRCWQPPPKNSGYLHVVSEVLRRGADPNEVAPSNPSGKLPGPGAPLIPPGGTPLMLRRYDSLVAIKALLAAGADPTARSSEGRTALDYAQAAAAEPPTPWNAKAPAAVKLLAEAIRKR